MASVALSIPAPFPTPGSRLSPGFKVELRRRHDETAPVETVHIHARTIASARHAARLAFPDSVILSVTRL